MVNRGSVCWADLAPRSRSERAGRRPVLLVSHDGFNLTVGWRSLMVVPITTMLKHQSPTSVFLPLGTASLSRDSLVLCHQITTLDRGKFSDVIGALPAPYLRQVKLALLKALAISARD